MLKPIPDYGSVEEIIQDAIKEEQSAEQWYRQAADRMQSPEMKEVLMGLAAMEAEHAATLAGCLEQYRREREMCRALMRSFD